MQACTSAHYPREQSVRLTHTFAHERIAQLYIPLRELRFLARNAFLCNREFQRNFLLHKKTAQRTTPVVVYPFMRLNIKIHNHSHNSHKPNELLHSDLIITFFHYLSTPYPICMPSKTLWLVIPYGILLLISIHPLILTISFTIQNHKTVAHSLISF